MAKQVLKTVYELDEVKEKAIEKNRYINVAFDDWSDYVIEEWKTKLKEIGFCNPKIYYSGFCSQGDGACFDNDSYRMDLDLLLNNVYLTEEEKERIYELKSELEINIYKISHHYCHERTRKIYIDHYICNKDDEKLIEKFEELLEEMRIYLCKQIYRDLESEYNSLTTNEAVYEALQAQACYFEEDGTISSVLKE
jgi:hypothetical protein